MNLNRTSYKNSKGQELLFVSDKAIFDGKKAIRGKWIFICVINYSKQLKIFWYSGGIPIGKAIKKN